MSTATVMPVSAMPPETRRVRAYFAPVDRVHGQPTVFDPSVSGGFNLDAPPSPWIDLGWIENFARKSGTTIGALAAGRPAAAAGLAAGSTATTLCMNAGDASQFAAGQMVAVDLDYAGQTGFVGSAVSAAYVRSASDVNNDADYVRRVTFNVARVGAVSGSDVQLAQPLIDRKSVV